MKTLAEIEYEKFQEKVRRTLYIDNLSPLVTEAVLKTAFNQFGNVTSINFLPSYTRPRYAPRAALVEMEDAERAERILSDMANLPFMISGMPRPVRARAAEAEMFADRPMKPGRRIRCCWLDSTNPDFLVAKELKKLAQKHASEASFLFKHQIAEEEKLHNQQAENLRTNHRKFVLIDSVLGDGAARDLARHYNMNLYDG